MKNLKKAVVKKGICALLTVAMLCTDTGVAVYATEGVEQKVLEKTVEETSVGDMQMEDSQTEESSKVNGQTEEDLEEEGETGETSPEKMPVNEENTDENSGGKNVETDVTRENLVTNDETVEGNPDVEDVESAGDAATEEFESENDIEEDAEENLETATKDSGDNIASGEYKENGNDITWVIDADGKLTVEGTGDFVAPRYINYDRTPWYNDRDSIESAEINVTGMTNASCMFRDCSNLASIDVSSFDTSNVTDMESMFGGCNSLTSIDVSSFVTSSVTNMDRMFCGCSSLTSIDLSNFDTRKVTDMGYMFADCSSLASIDMNSFATGNDANIEMMFFDCSSLTSIDLSSFNTSSVTKMNGMFYGCSSLTSIDLNGFDTSSVTDMRWLFEDCSSLTSIDVSSFDTSSVTSMQSMFYNCSSLVSIDVSNFDTSSVTDMNAIFLGCSSLTSIDVGNFDTSSVTNMSLMFYGCSSLESIDMSSFSASSATNMDALFSRCSKLLTLRTPYNLKLSVALPSGTWYQTDGTQITELPQNLDHSILIKKDEIPIVSAIKAAKTKTDYVCGNIINVDDLTVTYYDADSIARELEVSDYTTNADKIDMSTVGKKTLIITYHDDGNIFTDEIALTVTLENIIANGEYKENGNNITWIIDADGKLTVTGTGDFSSSRANDRAPWYENRESIISAEINVTDMVNATGMFYRCKNLTSVDLSKFNTRNVTGMYCMFSGCSNLTSLDLSNFDTSNVIDMGCMFQYCSSLTSLDVSNFDTSNVISMWAMFDGCSSLTSLDVSNFDTSHATTGAMFKGCSSLIKLNVSGFDTSHSTRMDHMFDGCSSLTSLDVSGFDTSRSTLMSWMFFNCSSLTSLDLSNFDTSQVTAMDAMLSGCSALMTIHTPCNLALSVSLPRESDKVWYDPDRTEITELPQNLNHSIIITKKSTTSDDNIASGSYKNITWVIDADGKLTVEGTGDFTGDSSSTSRAPWYNDRESIKYAEVNVTGMTNASNMFIFCNNLTSIDLSNFDTSQMTNMNNMFYGCSNLTSIDLSNFDTSQVTDMRGMFSLCSNLSSLDLSNFNTSKVTDMEFMFHACNKMTNLDVSGFDTSQVTNMSLMFNQCKSLTDLDVSGFDTSQVTDMHGMFFECSNLFNLDVSKFDTSQVTNMNGMFYNCSQLASLDLSSFNTSQVTNMSRMFSGCNKLTSLDLSSFNTSQVTDMSRMFSGCSSLINLDVSKFDVSQVTDASHMFPEGSNELQMIHTPYNLKLSVELPAGSWYRTDGTQITELPQNLVHSILIKKNEVPIVSALRIGKTKTNYMCGEIINLDDLTVTYYDAGSMAHELGNNDYTTNADDIDMSTPGKKVLIITYNDGKSILTGEIELTVVVPVESIILSDNMLSLKVGETAKLTATVTPDNAEDKTVIWVSSNRTVAEVEDGVVEALAIGECTITASAGGKSAICNITVEYEANGLTVAVPVATPESGRQLTAGSKVALTCETAGTEIYYTTGDSEKALAEPTEKSIRYTEPITINKDMYIKAVAIKSDSRSKTVTLHYTVADASDRVLKPYAVPGQGAVEKGTKVELKSDTPDAAIYYITGKNADMLGAVPVDDAYKYTEPIDITSDIVIKAIAKKDGMKDSDFSIFVYKIKETLTPPAAVPASGTVERGSYISLNAGSDANIYYTMDQSNPMTSGSVKLYESKIRVDGIPGSSMVIKAVAEKNGAYSEIVTFTYTVSENTVKGLRVMLAGNDEFTYTGNAIMPAIIVTNNGEELTEGEDYTVRYSNNVKAADKNASKAPKITVTGKGNLAKSRSVTFSITPKDIGDEEDVVGGNIVVVQGKTASPVLFYGGVKLTAKDFVNPDAKKKYSQDETITITGKGNFEGTRDIDVRVVAKEDLKKFTVTIDNQALKDEPLIYDGEAKTLDGYFEVFDAADKSSPLEEYSDYAVIYPKNNINAGKVKFTVVGLGEYYGTVTKAYTINPRVVKTDADGYVEVNINDGDNYPFRNGGVTIPDLTVTCDGNVLVPGKDYKVTYSNNKKICTDSKAKCTISFTGNYKGSKALVRKFNIIPALLDDVDQINGVVSVAVGDMIYTGNPGTYKSIPYVTVNGVLLKSSDYEVSYYKDPNRKQVIDGKDVSSSVDLADGDKQTVYVKIEGKENYEGTLTAEYNVYRLTEDVIDLAKAKVNFVGGSRAEYTGESVEPKIEVMYKSGGEWKKVDANDIGAYVTVTYINNVNKGKATVMINGNGGKYAGSKTAVFSIVPKSMK